MDPFRTQLDWIDGQRESMLRRVIDWSETNTGTGHLSGIARLIGEVRRAFATLGGEIEELPVGPAERIDAQGNPAPWPLGSALRVRCRPEAQLRVFLGIHLDTVYPPDGPFQCTQRVDSNTLRGPGVADAKGGIAVMLTALEALERSPFAAGIGWEVLLNPDEEIGSVGSAPLLTAAARRNHLGLVFEPALPGGAMVDRRRGVGNFSFVVRGRAAHAGRDFDRGRNAIVAAAHLVSRLHALNGRMSGVTINVGRLNGGGASNVVPDLAIAHANVRTTEIPDEPRIRKEIEAIAASVRANEGITVEMHGGLTSPPKIPDKAMRTLMGFIGECSDALGLKFEWKGSGGASDGNKLAAAGLPNVDSLGPRGGDIHSPSEFIEIDSLTERAKLSALLLMRLASGDIDWLGR